jgi:hypothetical protein
MIPYANQAVTAANYVVGAADAFADLMDLFTPSGVVGGPMTSVAGVANNVAVRRTKPTFRGSRGVIRITHKELVTNINASTGVATTPRFTGGNSVYQVNAGCASSFSWLSEIASNYDFYRFKRVRLVYVPLCATTQDGRVTLAYDPDSADPIPLDRQSLSSYACSVEGSAWATQVLDCDLTDTAKWYYTDASNTGTGTGAHNALLDQGAFFMATYGSSGSAPLGEMYVLYDVEFKDPQPGTTNVYQTFGTGAAVTQSLPTNAPIFNGTNTSTSVALVFTAPGRYLIHFTGAATAVSAPTTGSGGTVIANNSITSGSGSQFMVIYLVDTPTATLTLPGLTSLGNWTVYISKLPFYTTAIN